MEPNNPTPEKDLNDTPVSPAPQSNSDFSAEGIDIMPGPEQTQEITPEPTTPKNPTETPLNRASQMLDQTPLTPPRPTEVPPVRPQQPQPAAKAEPMNDPSIKPLRTFKSDAEEAVKYQNVSTIDIAVAEQKRREARNKVEVKEKKPASPGTFILVAVVVILLIAGGWYYWFISSQDTVEPTPIPATVKTIVPSSKGSTVYLEPNSNPLILISSKLAASNAGLGNIYTIIPTNSATSTAFAPIAQVFRSTKIPDRLKRSLSDTYMIGTYTYDANSPFIIVKNTFFQNAFSGMLDWEKTMRADLLPLIQVAHPKETAIATSTVFADTVVSNTDTRALKNEEGDFILLYAFADKDTIVIATNTSTLKYILDRLLSVRTIQ